MSDTTAYIPFLIRQVDGVGKNWLMRFPEGKPRVEKPRCLGVCGLARIISKTAFYLLKGIDSYEMFLERFFNHHGNRL